MATAPKHAAAKEVVLEETPRRKRHLWVIPAVLAGAVAGVYLGGSVYFMTHFLPNTTLDGDDISLQQTDYVAQLVSDRAYSFEGSIVGDGIDIPFSSTDIDYAFDGERYAEDALAQQDPWTWPLAIAEPHEIVGTPVASYDAAKIWNLVEPYVEENKAYQATLPHRGIAFDEEADCYVLDSSVHNAMLDRDAVIAVAEQAIANPEDMSTHIQIDGSCYKVDDETQAILDAGNFYANAKVHLVLDGVDGIDIDGKQISQWVTLNDDGTATLDEQAILDWGPGGLSDILDTVGKPRTYTRPDGEEITVRGGGPYGWLIKGAETSQLILDAIKSGEPQTVDVPTYQSAAKVDPGGQDWPDKYVDVDISEQHARMYIDGELVWETDVVTGQNDGVHDTPQGVFYITEHDTDVELFNAGTIVEGEEYEDGYNPEDGWRSHVDFWIAYDGSERGFHNADWRWQFGGDIYTWWGSHGCINMDYTPAKELYDLTEIGDAVIIHE